MCSQIQKLQSLGTPLTMKKHPLWMTHQHRCREVCQNQINHPGQRRLGMTLLTSSTAIGARIVSLAGDHQSSTDPNLNLLVAFLSSVQTSRSFGTRRMKTLLQFSLAVFIHPGLYIRNSV